MITDWLLFSAAAIALVLFLLMCIALVALIVGGIMSAAYEDRNR